MLFNKLTQLKLKDKIETKSEGISTRNYVATE